jgi:hypothetical protein
MKKERKARKRLRQAGTALLIAIFALLLISVVGIAMLVSTSADTALAGNYRTSTGAYYGALAGLEEARGRLLWKNPNYINNAGSYSNLLSPSGVPTWSLTQVLYIVNPGPGESVDPTSSNAANYPDTEYGLEFPGWGLSGAVVNTPVPSVSPVASAGLPGPSYKWVRINPATEQSLNMDVNGDTSIDRVAVLFYDPANANSLNQPTPGLVLSSPPVPATPPTPTAVEALEITALAVLPNGTQKILQYVVAPLIISAQVSSNSASPFGANFPAALTLAGNGVSYTGPQTTSFTINGQDQCAMNNLYYSIGYTNSADGAGIAAGAAGPGPAPGFANDYQGYPASGAGAPPPTSKGLLTIANVNPNPSNALLASSWMTPASLDSMAQDIMKSADVVIDGVTGGPAHGSNLPTMTPSAPMTVVVNGDLDLTSWHGAGYGLLLVTGTLTYDPNATWEGLVLVIGQGTFLSTQGGLNGFDGAVFLAKTHDSSGNLLSALGATSFSQTGSSGNFGRGINYNSCWISGNPGNPIIQGVRGPLINGPLSYKVLSFREINLQ